MRMMKAVTQHKHQTGRQPCVMVVVLLLIALFPADQGMAEDLPVPKALIALQEHLDMPVSRDWQGVAQGFSRWARKPGQERWELADVNLPPDKEALVQEDLRQLGFVQALKPVRKQYDYGVIPGAISPGMLQRIHYLVKLWHAGARFNRLVFLTGQRPLVPSVDRFQSLMEPLLQGTGVVHFSGDAAPMHETEAARLLYQYVDLPQSIRELPVDFIDTARTWQHQHWLRPNTRDTVKSWLQGCPAAGSVLMVSTQPHATYQHAVVRDELPDEFYLETVAPGVAEGQSLAVILDAVAGWLAQFNPAQGLNPAICP